MWNLNYPLFSIFIVLHGVLVFWIFTLNNLGILDICIFDSARIGFNDLNYDLQQLSQHFVCLRRKTCWISLLEFQSLGNEMLQKSIENIPMKSGK